MQRVITKTREIGMIRITQKVIKIINVNMKKEKSHDKNRSIMIRVLIGRIMIFVIIRRDKYIRRITILRMIRVLIGRIIIFVIIRRDKYIRRIIIIIIIR